MFYGLTMLALLVLRYKAPYKDKHRPYKVAFSPFPVSKLYLFLICIQVHLSIPIAVFLISVYLVVGPILEDPRIEYLYTIIYIVVGLLVYLLFVKYKFRCNTLVGKYKFYYSTLW